MRLVFSFCLVLLMSACGKVSDRFPNDVPGLIINQISESTPCGANSLNASGSEFLTRTGIPEGDFGAKVHVSAPPSIGGVTLSDGSLSDLSELTNRIIMENGTLTILGDSFSVQVPAPERIEIRIEYVRNDTQESFEACELTWIQS